MPNTPKPKNAGTFMGSETSRVEVVVYPNHPSEFNVPRKKMEFGSVPVREISTTTEHVVGVTTSKQLGSPAGSFEVQIKSDRDLRIHIEDGDWVDITFTRHEEKHHTMRGIVMTIQQEVSASSGPTVATYTLAGSEFGIIFDEQQFWFDQVTQGDYFPWIASQLWGLDSNFANGRPDVTVATLLRGFLQPAANVGAGFWHLPAEMPLPLGPQNSDAPVDTQERNFADVFTFVDGYSHIPPRTSGIIPSQFTANASSVWALAKEFADETLCEFFTDLVDVTDLKIDIPGDTQVGQSLPPGNSIVVGNSYIVRPVSPGETHMAVIFRDAPFPNTVRDRDSLLSAPYFTLPLVEVQPQHILESTLARQGVTRKNTFFFGPTIQQDRLAPYHDFQLPIMDIESVKHHGIRRFDAESRYITDYGIVDPEVALDVGPPTEQTLESLRVWRQMAYDYRDIVRDLHCMNHLLQSGSIALNHGRPDIRVGTRFRILGAGPEQDFTCYVEGVQHTWSYVTGTRTTITVSHGWTGTDQSYVAKLRECIDRYKVYVPKIADPSAEDTETADSGQTSLDSFKAGLVDASYTSASLFHDPLLEQKRQQGATQASGGESPPGKYTLRPGEMAVYDDETGTVTGTTKVSSPKVKDAGTSASPKIPAEVVGPPRPVQVIVLPAPARIESPYTTILRGYKSSTKR